MRLHLIVFAAAASLPLFAQQILVAPAGYANLEGNGSNVWPWNQYISWPYVRMQEIYDSTNFTNQGVQGPIRISGLRYRADGLPGSWPGGVWPNVLVDMSTAATDYLAPSLTFAGNHGPDRTTVYSGPVGVQPGSSGTPGPWYVSVPLLPFLYDPSSGDDLVVDVEILGALLGTSYHVDHVSGGNTVPPPLGTRLLTVSSGSPDASSISIHYTPVTEFTFDPVAAYTNFAPGCAGTAGVPGNQATARPIPGQTMTVVIGNLPAPEVVVLCLGWSNSIATFGPLPLDLAPFGAPGCRLNVAPDWSVVLPGSAGAVNVSIPIPGQAVWLGARFYTQALALDLAANTLGATSSDAAVVHIGY